MIYFFIFIGLIVIAGLLAFIFKHLAAQKQLKLEQEATVQKARADALHHRQYLIDSIRILSKGMEKGELRLSEGCIRLKVLLDNLVPHLLVDAKFMVFNHVYNETAHIPRLKEWKALTADERRKHEVTLQKLEMECQADIREALVELNRYPLERMQ
ncbi:DUF2489 domain-containing protein [Nitrincola alkalilacustris]|uniref:DUF2489 domain-containing protein n=1 Tax=Nitrincola alkalilacustris TaxID=1571224 RepID=UPI00124ECBB2|nr:DUF2489 domain-containing protein [Nitrincola alkalilacustris]